MIKSSLRPTPLRSESGLETFRQMIREARAIIAETRRCSRTKALRYARRTRTRGYSDGYRAGLQVAHDQCREVIEELKRGYLQILDKAASDIEQLARITAGEIVDSALMTHPELLRSWIQQSIAALKGVRTLKVSLHPRYTPLVEMLSMSLPEGVALSIEQISSAVDFRVEGETGGIEFSWRDAIQQMPIQAAPSLLSDND